MTDSDDGNKRALLQAKDKKMPVFDIKNKCLLLTEIFFFSCTSGVMTVNLISVQMRIR